MCFVIQTFAWGGANLMAETKRIMVSLPNSLVEEVDFIVSMEKKNRSEFIKEAMKLYIREKRKVEVYEQLKYGYVEMSKINLTLAEMGGLEQDMAELNVYEAKLTGGVKKCDRKRGDVFYADLSPVVGSEQGGVRPVLVIQNDIGNKYSPTIIIAAITSQINKAKLPTHVEINAPDYGLPKDSVVLLEQVRTIDKKRLREKNW